MFGLPAEVLTQVGLTGVFVLLVGLGILVPKWVVSKMVEPYKAIAQNYKEAWEKSDARQDVNAAQTEKLLAGMEITNRLLTSLNEKVGHEK